MKDLSESALRSIQALSFDPEAQIIYCLLPLASIYWTDEVPEKHFHHFSEGEERDFVLRLFAIRINFWDTGEMKPEEEALWEDARTRFPDWPLFRRLHLTDDQRNDHESVRRDSEEFFTVMLESADEVKLSPGGDGFTSFSATIHLDPPKRKWWQFWKR